jgi:hypothetical protein
MSDQEGLKLVYTGSVIEADFLRSLLEENGIGFQAGQRIPGSCM